MLFSDLPGNDKHPTHKEGDLKGESPDNHSSPQLGFVPRNYTEDEPQDKGYYEVYYAPPV